MLCWTQKSLSLGLVCDYNSVYVYIAGLYTFVFCFLSTTALSSDTVRLMKETSECSGILAVKSNQSWLTVCEDDFDQHKAEVVCSELGCGPPSPQQGALRRAAVEEKILCEGHESARVNCKGPTSARNNCSPSKAVTLTCSGMAGAAGFIWLASLLALIVFLSLTRFRRYQVDGRNQSVCRCTGDDVQRRVEAS